MSMALIFAQKEGYEVDSNQELIAQVYIIFFNLCIINTLILFCMPLTYIYKNISILYNFTGTGKSCRFFFFLHAYHGFIIQIIDSANCRWTYTAGKFDIMWNFGERVIVDRAIFSTFATSNYSFYRFYLIIQASGDDQMHF